jgi:tRNA (guanine10-N2)-dimethyltransferase
MTHNSIFILGRQPAIGRAELESIFGAEHLEPIGDSAIACDVKPEDVDFLRLGSSIRMAQPLLTIGNAGKWADIGRKAGKELAGLLDYLPAEGKLKLGLSAFDLDISAAEMLRTGLELKKVCKKYGRSVRVVPNTEPALNSAQVLHNQLTGDLGIELLFINYGNKVYLAKTVAIQNIEAYTRRDRERPKRDAFVGMLPPKLAQTIVNLASGPVEPTLDNVVLDPFCGTGVILQEALLMGYGAYGTDLEPRMVDYTRANLEWLDTHGVEITPKLEVGDATTHQWTHPFSTVACESYLGRPLTSWPDPDKLHEIIGNCNVIVEKFLRNIATQMPAGTRLCVAVPAWQAPSGKLYHLSLLDRLEVLGYNRISFQWAQEQEMVYRRPDQMVARELLVITRN